MDVSCLLLDHQYLLCPLKFLELLLLDTLAHGSDPSTKEAVLGEYPVPLRDLCCDKFEAAVVRHQVLEGLTEHSPVLPLLH